VALKELPDLILGRAEGKISNVEFLRHPVHSAPARKARTFARSPPIRHIRFTATPKKTDAHLEPEGSAERVREGHS
jgi:hypothetical protein